MAALPCAQCKVVPQSALGCQEPIITCHATASLFSIPPRRKAMSTGLVHAVQAVNKTI